MSLDTKKCCKQCCEPKRDCVCARMNAYYAWERKREDKAELKLKKKKKKKKKKAKKASNDE